MTMEERISLFEEGSQILAKLASQRDENSEEYAALKTTNVGALFYQSSQPNGPESG
jgi:hypothetical protein